MRFVASSTKASSFGAFGLKKSFFLFLCMLFLLLRAAPVVAQGINSSEDVSLPIGAGGTTAMWITPAQKVGVGTASPQALLDIAGGLRLGQDPAPSLCNTSRAGTLQFISGFAWLCDGTAWRQLGCPSGKVTMDGVCAEIQTYLTTINQTACTNGLMAWYGTCITVASYLQNQGQYSCPVNYYVKADGTCASISTLKCAAYQCVKADGSCGYLYAYRWITDGWDDCNYYPGCWWYYPMNTSVNIVSTNGGSFYAYMTLTCR